MAYGFGTQGRRVRNPTGGQRGRGLTQTVTDAHSLAKHSQGSAANGEQPTSEAERGQGALKSEGKGSSSLVHLATWHNMSHCSIGGTHSSTAA